MDRREFLSSGSGTAIALTATVSVSHGAQWLRDRPSAQTLNRATFESWLHSSFEVRQLGTRHLSRAQLTAVHAGVQAAGLEQFHVILRGDSARQGLCELRHQSGTELRLWLDPMGMDGGAPVMRATFSLITPA